jgi:hypothetical protein
MQEPTLSQKINELLCGIIYAATGYDVVSDGALVAGFFTLGATGVIGGSMELADPAIATFKVTFKSVLNTMNSTVIDAAWKTYKKLPKSGSSIMHIMAKVPKESMTAATEAIAKMLAEGPIVAEKGLKLLDKSEALLKSMNPKTVIDAYTSLFKVESKLGIKVSPIVAELGNQTDEYLQNLVKLASDEKFFTKVSNIKSQLGLGSKVTEIKFVNVVADKVTAWGKFESGVIKIATDNPSLTANPQYSQVMLKNIVPHEMGHASFSGITGNLNDAAKYATEELGVDKLLRNKLTGADLDDYLLTEKAMLEGTDFIDLVKNGADEGLADAAVGYAKALKYGGDIPNNIKAEVLSAGKDKFLAAYGRNMKPYESQAFVDGFVKYSDDIAKGADELAVNSNWLPAALITMPVLLATAVAATPPQCESGVCCDTNGYYMNSTNACAVNFSFEMQCSGLNIQKRNSTKYCSGSSSTCDGSLVWGNWVTQSTCPSNQVCSNAVCITPVCSTNSQCGTNSWVDLNYCNSNNIWGKYRTFTCNNPGTIFASCTYADSNQLRINCSAGQICSNATCITPICSNNSDCGVNAFIGNPFCFSNSVMQAFRTFTCNNPATLSASCSYVDSNQIKSACSTAQYCSNATCVNKECTSGACCDSNGFFKSSSNVCQLGISSEKKCESSSVLLRTSDKYCSGISSACDGNTIWNSWSLSNTCASSEYCSNGACVPKQCVTGVCCDANGFFKSNTNICDSNVSTSKYCEGNKVMRVSLVQMCSGSSNTCLGNIVTNPPVLVQTCSSSEYCSSGACVPKQCTSGACCDVNGFFKPSTVMCNLNADNETVCFNSTSTITRTAVLYCSGSSSVCDGNKVWLGWKVPINCSVNQLCQSGICVTKQCTSGACCDTNRGLYQPRGLNCASAPSEARCNGNSVELRSVNYTCGGDSAVCGSENLSYGSWAIDENCASNEYCSEGICTTAICSNDSECNDTNQYTIDACINPSTSLSSCTHTPVVIACSSAVQCGTNGWVNTPFCSSNSIKDAYRTYVCNNAATPSSSCSFTDVLKVKSTCPSGQICNNAECLVPNCINDSGCNDNNSLTIDKCLEPNTVFSSCTHTQIACTTSTQCGVNAWLNQNTCNGNNIGDYFRTFTCKNPGTVTSLCTFTDVLKTKSYCASGTLCQNGICVKPTCSSSTQCNDLNAYTVDLCINAGKLTSACTHTPVRCLTSADCNDFNPFTLDSCKNPKLVTSYCAYTQIACMTNANCDDNNPLTIDSCSYPKTTSSRCNHVAIKCATNANCDDSNSLTSNICINPGTTASYCKYYPLIPTTIWSVAPTSSGKYFSSTTCNTLSKVTCPNELGWVGNRVTYSFNLPLGQLTDNLALKFNVISKNDLNNTNVLLKLTTGISTFNLKLVNPGLEINRLGEFSVIIPKSNFTQGTTNYIQLYGTNITQVGTGKTPPNFKIDSISLNQVQ